MLFVVKSPIIFHRRKYLENTSVEISKEDYQKYFVDKGKTNLIEATPIEKKGKSTSETNPEVQ